MRGTPRLTRMQEKVFTWLQTIESASGKDAARPIGRNKVAREKSLLNGRQYGVHVCQQLFGRVGRILRGEIVVKPQYGDVGHDFL